MFPPLNCSVCRIQDRRSPSKPYTRDSTSSSPLRVQGILGVQPDNPLLALEPIIRKHLSSQDLAELLKPKYYGAIGFTPRQGSRYIPTLTISINKRHPRRRNRILWRCFVKVKRLLKPLGRARLCWTDPALDK
jgi:hypothetical protein